MEIEYPALGSVVVEGVRFDHDVVIERGVVRARDKGPSRVLKPAGQTPLSAAEEIPWTQPRLVIGSGHSGRLPILQDVYAVAAARGVELVVLPTAEACALLRTVEAGRVDAILHVTC